MTIGDETDLAAVQFSFDDAITLSQSTLVCRCKQTGFTGSIVSIVFEVSLYNSAGVAQGRVVNANLANPINDSPAGIHSCSTWWCA